jgi:hypothetical protein
MTYKEYAKSKTTEELQKEAKQLQYAVDTIGCFNVRDLRLLESIEEELDNRE